MGQKLPPDQMELYRRVDEVLHYVWDPIGAAGTPEARDEYYRYLPGVYSLIERDAPSEEIVHLLLTTATDRMGLSGTRHHRKHAEKAAEILQRWRQVIANRPPKA